MPFSKRGKIVVVNQTGADIPNFYYAVDYETLEELPENTLRFHASGGGRTRLTVFWTWRS